jgi:CBS domain-containing protein/ribosome-associated translation inhibitor RaiA
MSKGIVYVSPEDNVSKLISLIEEHCFREILIIEDERLKGIVYSKEIAKKGIIDPSKTKVSNLMNSPPPTLSAEDEVDNAARLIFKTGLRALPVVEYDKVVGIVSLHDIVDFASKTNNFKKTTAESIMSLPETITEDVDIGAARRLMREKNISRIPIVDKNQKMTGIITIFDLLKAVKPRERMSFYSMAAEKETLMKIPVSVVVNDTPTIVERNDSLNKIVNLLKRYETDGVTVVENQIPVGVVTEKDLLEFYISTLEQKGIYYQIMGLKDEDDFILSTVNRMIGDTLQKLSKIYKIQFFFLHVKSYDKKGKVKYSIRTRLLTNSGTFVSKSYAWDLRTAVDEALDNLQRITIKDKKWKAEKTIIRLRHSKSR